MMMIKPFSIAADSGPFPPPFPSAKHVYSNPAVRYQSVPSQSFRRIVSGFILLMVFAGTSVDHTSFPKLYDMRWINGVSFDKEIDIKGILADSLKAL
jgi:hypothetical protein